MPKQGQKDSTPRGIMIRLPDHVAQEIRDVAKRLGISPKGVLEFVADAALSRFTGNGEVADVVRAKLEERLRMDGTDTGDAVPSTA